MNKKVILLVIILLYICLSLFNYSFITEDAFIYFRFVENLINGYGCAFNPGEKIEACSSMSWLFLLTALGGFDFPILTAAKVLGIICGCFSLFLIFKITEKFTTQMPWVVLPSLLSSLSMSFLLFNQLGLETSLYTLTFLCLIFVCLESNSFVYFPVVSIIFILTRPEALFLLLGLIPGCFFYRSQGKKIVFSFTILVVLFLIVTLVKFFYFQDLLPSPFYKKIFAGKYSYGILYLHDFFKSHYLYYFCLPLIFTIWKKWNWEEKRFILFGFIIVFLLWAMLGGAEPKPSFRYCAPVIPLIHIYVITGIKNAFSNLTRLKKVAVTAYILLFCYLSLMQTSNPMFGNPIADNVDDFLDRPREYLRFVTARMRKPAKFNHIGNPSSKDLLLGEFVKLNYNRGSTVLYDQMGQAPYQAGIDYNFIDSLGLTDKTIGRYYFHKRMKGSYLLQCYENISSYLIGRVFPQVEFMYSRQDTLDYIFRQDPDVIIITSPLCYSKMFIPYWLLKDKRFSSRYNLNYLISGTKLLFEKKGLNKKPFHLPKGLYNIIFEKEIAKKLKSDHPVFNAYTF